MYQIIILLYFIGFSVGSNILVVFPVPDKTHSVLGDSLVRSLLSFGHEVTYVTPFPKEKVHNLEYVAISPVLLSSEKLSLADVNGVMAMETFGTTMAQNALKHPDMQTLMANDTLHFDLIIAEWYYSGLLAPLSSIFECPLIWYTHTDVSWQSLSLMRVTVPSPAADFSIKDRLHEMASQLYLSYRNYSTEMSAYEDSYRNIFESKRIFLPNYEYLVYNASLLLVDSHELLGDAWPLPPNVKYIGGHHLSDRIKPLPKNLNKLLDDSNEGVIYVDIETKLVKDEEHQNLLQELLEVFSKSKMTVILKYEDVLLNLPKTVHVMKSPPLQSILSHSSTIAFISHGDMCHITAAVRHAVPTIVIPITREQEATANSLVKKGLVLRARIGDMSWEVQEGLNAVMGNMSYKENLKSARALFRHRLTSPSEEFLHYVQTASLPAAVLLRPSKRSSVIERYNLDVLLLILLFIWFCSKLVKLFNTYLYDEDLEKKDL